MGLYLNAKCKICRRAGEKLLLRGERCNGPKCAIVKRNYPPGVHGQTSKRRLTPFGLQLKEKQKAKRTYGLRERQMKNYYLQSKKIKGDTARTFLKYLEMRLDNVLYRLGFAKSRNQARQLATHKHVTINGRVNNRPSAQIKVNDTVAIKPSARENKIFQDMPVTLAKQETPLWLKLNAKDYSGQVIGEPTMEEMRQNFDIKVIVEFYSR
ncbi:MAG: 30S ribosomal protein S4 [bacterium]|nr:30S ribosomal protein S4 [bacterium]